MNIRTLSNPIVSAESRAVAESKKLQMSESAEDRDANGRREKSNEENKDRLSGDEFQKAKEYLEKLEAVRNNVLSLIVEDGEPYRIFILKDQSGQVVRRITEWEMRPLLSEGSDKKTGQIFDKSA